MTKQNYGVILAISVLFGIILFFFKNEISGSFLLGILFVLSMISVSSIHGIIAHSIDPKRQRDYIKYPLLMGVLFAVIFFIWVFFIIPLFCPDFIGNLK